MSFSTRLTLDRIISLLHDDNYTAELRAFRRSVQRLKIRLRNNKLNAQLKHLKTLIHRVEVSLPVKLFEQFSAETRTKKSTVKFISYLNQYIKRLDEILDKAISVYGSSQAHFKVGHLVQHYVVIRASLARLTFCFKALLVYTSDLYQDLISKNSVDLINKIPVIKDKLINNDQLKSILLKHECKPKLEQNTLEDLGEGSEKNPIASETVGQLIDRKTLRPIRACKRLRL